MEPSDEHAASLPPRIRALLARAQRETGLQQLCTLAAASQMLREQLDAVDRHLRLLLATAEGTDRPVTGDIPAPADLLATLDHLADHLASRDLVLALQP